MKKRGYRWRGLGLLASLLWLCSASTGSAFDFTQRSISKSAQFIVYSPDIRLRMAVTGYAETAKQGVLELLSLGDHWKFPIVIDLRRPASTDSSAPLSQVRLIQTEGGWKVQIDVMLREGEFKQVRFPQLVIRAILLELAYREHPPEIGAPYPEPPSWLVEGFAQNMLVRASGVVPNAALFRQLIETGRLPKIRDFLKENVEVMDPTSLAVHGSCAGSLLDLLAGTPGGPAGLVRILKGLRESPEDPAAQLLKYFPALGNSETDLEKWWTLGLARGSSLDRHLALTVPETDSRLTSLLRITVVTDEKKKTRAEFELSDYKKFLKYPNAKAALSARSGEMAGLLSQAHPLFRPVLMEYRRIAAELATGKSRRIGDALNNAAKYRGLILGRMDQIDDYLNWYEATQMPEQSGAFEDFMQGAKTLEKGTPPKRNDAITTYIDQLQREFE
ncbi:MAG: hypothetical protein NTZ46_09010 [Verrucomicrobia bacterium]|nr:hypothetical protein [Verrucomicrobiota bacterium]